MAAHRTRVRSCISGCCSHVSMVIVAIGIVLCTAGVGYCYLLYPAVIRSLARRSPEPTYVDDTCTPSVSIILAVHNEEQVIEQCLDSLLALDYASGRLNILVGSDGSTDRTDEILRRYAVTHPQVRPIYFSEQRGKMGVLNDLVDASSGEMLFFVDADIRFGANALRLQTRHFADPAIGAVAGSYEIQTPSATTLYESEQRYAAHDQEIRTAEATYHSTVALFGGNYVIRRSLWRALPDGLVHDDFFVVLSVLDQGYRVIAEPEAVGYDIFVRTMADEFRRKIRSASRGYHTLSFFPELLLPRAGRTAFLLWSHKMLRWLSPFLAIMVVALSWIGVAVSGSTLCSMILLLAGAVVGVSLLGLLAERMGMRLPVVHRLSWLFVMNIAYIVGTMRFITRSDEAIWKPSSRPSVKSAAAAAAGGHAL